VRQTGVEAEEFWENGKRYWSVTREFTVKPDGWNPMKVLDFGYTELGDGGRRIIMEQLGPADKPKEGTFNPVRSPVPLQGGKRAGKPGTLKFIVYPPQDFGEFNS